MILKEVLFHSGHIELTCCSFDCWLAGKARTKWNRTLSHFIHYTCVYLRLHVNMAASLHSLQSSVRDSNDVHMHSVRRQELTHNLCTYVVFLLFYKLFCLVGCEVKILRATVWLVAVTERVEATAALSVFV